MGIAYTLIGLVVSFVADSPANPTIISVLTDGFGLTAAVGSIRRKVARFSENRQGGPESEMVLRI
jgi:ABC-type Mn2+/Zn2+ transport system permease subunit